MKFCFTGDTGWYLSTVVTNILNVNEPIILLTNEYSNILLAITISLAGSVIQRDKKFIHEH